MCAEKDDWYMLPRPADWWPEGYNFQKHGFEPENNEAIAAARRLALTAFAGEISPEQFEKMEWDMNEFVVF